LGESVKGVFARKASGLVRAFAPQDALYMNAIGVAAMVSIVPLLYMTSTMYPGADLYLAFTIALIVAIPFGWTYAMLSTAYPRSGGDYVYNSRIVHPSYGLAGSGLYLVINIIGVGQFPMFTAWYISSIFAILGTMYNNPSLTNLGSYIASVEGTIVTVTLIIIWSAIINILGVRFHAIIQRIYFVIAAIGTLILFGVLAFTTHQYFVNAFDASVAQYGTSFSDLIARAKEAGYQPPPFSMATTLLATVFLFEFLTTAWPVMIAGEVKSPAKSLILSCVGGIFLSWVLYMVTTGLYYRVFTPDFANAVTWLHMNKPDMYPLPHAPYLTYLIGFLSRNPIILALIGIGFICWGLSLTPNHIMIVSRPLFAYAMDKVFPGKFASVSERTHTPVFSIVVTAILGEIVLIITAYAGWLIGLTLNVAVGCAIYFLFTLFAGVLFPILKKDLFEASPAIVKAKIGPIPIVSITGAFSGIAMLWALSTYFMHPELSGPVSPASVSFIIVVIILFALDYYIARWYRRKKEGIDISLNYTEIPPT